MTNETQSADHLLTTIEVSWFPFSPHGLFRVGRGDNDRYYAVRDIDPRFCVCADCQDDAEARAGEVIEAFFQMSRPSPETV